MTVAAAILSVSLILEFVFGPLNLRTGRTMDNFVRFTGFRPTVAAPGQLSGRHSHAITQRSAGSASSSG